MIKSPYSWVGGKGESTSHNSLSTVRNIVGLVLIVSPLILNCEFFLSFQNLKFKINLYIIAHPNGSAESTIISLKSVKCKH